MTEARAPAEDSLSNRGQRDSLGPEAKASSLPPPSLKGLSCAKNCTQSLCSRQLVAKKSLGGVCLLPHQNTVGSGARGRTGRHKLQGPLRNDTWHLCFKVLGIQDGDSSIKSSAGHVWLHRLKALEAGPVRRQPGGWALPARPVNVRVEGGGREYSGASLSFLDFYFLIH